MTDTATDEQLAVLFNCRVDELPRIATEFKRGLLSIQTFNGQWVKYTTSKQWQFYRDDILDEPSD